MHFKGTLVLLLAFVALGGYVYFVEYRGREERERAEAALKKVFPIEAGNVAELTLKFPDRTASALRKGESEWQMTAPAGMEADVEAWESLASNLANVEKDETVVTEKPDLAQYGLDKPFVEVTAKLQNGDTIGILFGSQNPRKTFRYAKRTNSDEIFLSSTSWSSGFDKSLFDLRNKELLDFDTEAVDAVRIAVSGRPEIEVQKSGESDWQLKKPVDAAADESEVSSFISSIQFARATDFADTGMDLRKAGLDPPEARITLRDQGGSEHVLLLGRAVETDKLYAKDASRPAIFIAGKDLMDKVRRPVLDWRDKTIVRFMRDSVDEIEVTRGSETMSFKKVGTEWQFADGRKPKQDRISDWLSSLEFDRATGIVDAPRSLASYGVEPGRIRVTLRQGGNEIAVIRLGADAPGTDGVYARVGSSSAILTVPKTLYDKFNVGAEDLAEPEPAAEEPPK